MGDEGAPSSSESQIIGLRVGATILHIVALIVTIYRLVHRYRIKRLSWDDAFAFLGFIFDFQELSSLWLIVYVDHRSFTRSNYDKWLSILYWTINICFTLTICCTRLSLWASIRRILAPGKFRTVCIPLAVVTFLSSLTLVVIKACTCDYSSSPAMRDYPILCTPTTRMAGGGFQSAVDIALSILIIGVPSYAVWGMGLSYDKRNLLMLLFTASFATLAAALAHNVYLLNKNPLLNHFTSHFEAAVSLIVCNVHIVVPSIYARFVSGDDAEESLTRNPTTGIFAETSPPRSHPLQTSCNSTSLTMAFANVSQSTTNSETYSTAPSEIVQTNPPLPHVIVPRRELRFTGQSNARITTRQHP